MKLRTRSMKPASSSDRNGHFLAFDAPHDVAVGLRRTVPPVEHDGLAPVGGHDDVLVVGHDAQELDRQNLDDVVDVHHVAPPHHVAGEPG